MADKDAFNITLAHASNLLAQARNQKYSETRESLKYYTSSVQAVSKRLQHATERTSDGVIGTILGFACLDVRSENSGASLLWLIQNSDNL
jgi:murein L,D-transpeptidase YcbB/YkuD